jgi:hypothetical protein
MAAGKYNFVIEQGSTVDFEIQYKDSASVPVDLYSHHAKMQLRSGYGSDAKLYLTLSSSLDTCGGGLNLSGSKSDSTYPKPLASGAIGIYITGYSSSFLDFNEAYYDLELYSGSGTCQTVTRVLEGKIKLSKEVTV